MAQHGAGRDDPAARSSAEAGAVEGDEALRREGWLPTSVVLAAAGTFGVWTALPGPHWHDTAEFAAVGRLLSLSHPPGHPLHAQLVHAGELLIATTESALAGQGAALGAALEGRECLMLADYVNQRGMVEAGVCPGPGGLSAWEMLQQAAAGAIRALLVFADDPFELFPALAGEAFARAELTLVADALRTATVRRADVVLPGALLAEKRGHVVSFDGRRTALEPVASPPGGWTEGALAVRLAEALAARRPAGTGPHREIAAAPPAGDELPPAESPSAAYPFMAALDTTTFWNAHALTIGSVSAWREGRGIFADFPPGYVTLNPEDARALGLHHAGNVALRSPGGTVILPARLHPRALPGTVWVPLHAWEHVGSRLGALDFDPRLRIPVFRPRAVRVARPQA